MYDDYSIETIQKRRLFTKIALILTILGFFPIYLILFSVFLSDKTPENIYYIIYFTLYFLPSFICLIIYMFILKKVNFMRIILIIFDIIMILLTILCIPTFVKADGFNGLGPGLIMLFFNYMHKAAEIILMISYANENLSKKQ